VKKIKVTYKKLGKEKVYGFANLGDNEIEIDPRLKGKKHLEIMLHECLHILYPEAEEDEIVRNSIILTNTLWWEHYRRVDNNNSTTLQDGSI
jgi:hypothetical protein